MRIQTTLIRTGGSHVEMADGTIYHFAPTDTDPRHIAEVRKNDHVKRLLAIDGYEVAAEEAPEDALEPTDPLEPVDPLEPLTAGDPAGTDAGTDDADIPNPLSMAPVPQIPDLNAMSHADLQALFKTKFMREPNPRAGRAKLIDALTKHYSAPQSGQTDQPEPEPET
jgi:hypothetical protein